MRNKYLGVVSLLYGGIIIYILLSNTLSNYLAKNLQIYIMCALPILIIMGITILFNKTHYKFKITDLVLLLPLVILLFAGDAKVTTSFAKNRTNKSNVAKIKEKEVKENKKVKEDNNVVDSNNIDIKIVDENYEYITSYFTYSNKSPSQEGKTVTLKGMINKDVDAPEGYIMLGKYVMSCCAADAIFTGVAIKTDNNEVLENNKWYEVVGTVKKLKKNKYEYNTYLEITSYKKISSKKQKQYVYPCYSYKDGNCEEVTKYKLDY